MTATRARLVYDSSRCRDLVGVRAGPTDGRSLSFRGRRITVDVVLNAEDRESGFTFGQVVRNADGAPVPGAAVGLDAASPVETDCGGHFSLPTGVLRQARLLSVRTADDVVTCPISPMR